MEDTRFHHETLEEIVGSLSLERLQIQLEKILCDLLLLES